MANKKGKSEHASTVPNRDIIHRLNFMYQASAYLSSIPVSNASQIPSTDKRRGERRPTKTTFTAGDLAQTYVKMMKTVGQKSTVKIDPGVKRTLCKSCNTVLIPGTTVSVRVKKSPTHGHVTVYTCLKCTTSLRMPAPPTLDEAPMNVDTPDQPGQSNMRLRRGSGKPRTPPLFAREVGHIVFCGNDPVVREAGRGHGVYIV